MEEISNRTRTRYMLTLIILITIPCYLLGIILLRLGPRPAPANRHTNPHRHGNFHPQRDPYALPYPYGKHHPDRYQHTPPDNYRHPNLDPDSDAQPHRPGSDCRPNG